MGNSYHTSVNGTYRRRPADEAPPSWDCGKTGIQWHTGLPWYENTHYSDYIIYYNDRLRIWYSCNCYGQPMYEYVYWGPNLPEFPLNNETSGCWNGYSKSTASETTDGNAPKMTLYVDKK